MDHAFSLSPIMLDQLMEDVNLGTGQVQNAYNAQIIGYSIQMAFAFLFQTNAGLLIKLVFALVAIKDMMSIMDPVFSQNPTLLLSLMQDARYGTGKSRPVKSVLLISGILQMESVLKCRLIVAHLILQMDCA